MKCASLYTLEMDDFKLALKELTDQLNNQITLQSNTIGIINCHPEFLVTGVVEYLSENLPFETIGITTASQATNGTCEDVSLTIFVMTADDVEFTLGLTSSISDGLGNQMEDALKGLGLVSGQDNDIKLGFIFPPVIFKNAGDEYPEKWAKFLPGVPLFGAMSCDATATLTDARGLLNGKIYKYEVPFLLCRGNINPRFMIATLSNDAKLPYRGEVTKSQGNYVYQLNGMDISEYMKDIGFLDINGYESAFWQVPFEITSKSGELVDGVPVLRCLTWESISKGKPGSFLGKVEEGSLFVMRDISADAIKEETNRVATAIADLPEVNGVLSFACTLRRISMLDTDAEGELKIIKQALGSTPFMTGYVAGEICPTSVREKGATNRFHNFSIVFCIL